MELNKMVRYRRSSPDNPDDEYFLTIVTRNRIPHFSSRNANEHLWLSLNISIKEAFADLIAWVFMPDHLHILFKMGNMSYMRTVEKMKRRANKALLPNGGSLWQDRYWEHRIRDENDRIRHVDYIHFNPVKHGFVKATRDWPYSSFLEYVKRGWLSLDWASYDGNILNEQEFGE